MRSLSKTAGRILAAAGLYCIATGLVACQSATDYLSFGDSNMSSQTAEGVQHANDSNFKQVVLSSETPVLVDFYAPWCGPCRMLSPVLDDLARENSNATIVKVNVDESPQTAQTYGISSIPALKVFRGGQVVAEHRGVASKAELEALLGN
jgi:thioredoxin 1